MSNNFLLSDYDINANPPSYISSANSSTTALGSGIEFTGIYDRVENYSEITLLMICDTNATGTLYFEFSTDGTNLDRQKIVPVSNGESVHTLVTISKYFRVRYVNDATAQTFFRLQTIYHILKNKELTSTATQVISDYSDVQNTRSVIVAKNSNGTYSNVESNQLNDLKTSLSILDKSAFGELKANLLTPIIQELFTFNINTRKFLTTTTGSGSVTQANAMAVCSTGTTTGSDATLETKKRIRYRPGEGVLCRFTAVFTAGVANTTQLAGFGDTDDGLFFGYNGTEFGILHRNGASGSPVDTWITQSNWDEDKADGTGTLDVLDTTKGNVYEIQFQYLGFGSIRFYIEKSHPGDFVLVHSIDFANAYTQPSLADPSLPFCLFVDNDTTTSDIIVKSASCAAFIEGESKILGPSNSIDNIKSGIGSTLTNVLTIRNKSTYVGKTNHELIFPKLLNVAAIGNTKPATIKLIIGATLAGSPSYTDIDTNTSIVDYDIAGTTVTNGNVIFTSVVGKDASISEQLSGLEIFIPPGDTLTIAVSTSSGSVEAAASITWNEDI